MRVIAIVNQKGGSGKTTTAINLAAIYAHRGFRTLLVDLDPQSHCAVGLGVPENQLECTIASALLADLDTFDPDPLLWEVSKNLHLAPSTMRLATLEAPGGGLHELPDKDRRVEKLLKTMAGRFDRCLIDCPPTIGLLTFNGLRAAREALIPVETGFFALRGAEKQWQTIQRLITHINRPIACHLLPTLHKPDSQLSRNILHALQREFAGQLVPTVIEDHESLREAVSMGQPIMEYAPDSPAHRQFKALVDWMEDHQARPIVDIEIMPPPTSHIGLMTKHGSGIATGISSEESITADVGVKSGGKAEKIVGRAAELARRINDLARQTTDSAMTPTIPSPPADTKTAPLPAPILPPRMTPSTRPSIWLREKKTGVFPPPDVTVPPPQTSPPASVRCQIAINSPHPQQRMIAPEEKPQPVSPVMKVSAHFGVRITDRGVLFVQPGDIGQSVFVAGDFNHWSPSATPLKINESSGNFETLIVIPPGVWRYRLIVDGRWLSDAYNDRQQCNAHAEPNSVLVVESAREIMPV